MSHIKLKDLVNEITTAGGIVSSNPWVKEERDEQPSIDVNELVKSIGNYNKLGENIYGKGSLKEVAESLSSIAENAAQHTLSETEDMFDKVTVSRNMKELTGLSKQFSKVALEANSLQERMSGLYEDMGHILGRYYEINEDCGEEHEEEQTDESLFNEGDDYKAFFKKALEKWGASSPADLKDEDKKEFYNYVDRNWKADKETD